MENLEASSAGIPEPEPLNPEVRGNMPLNLDYSYIQSHFCVPDRREISESRACREHSLCDLFCPCNLLLKGDFPAEAPRVQTDPLQRRGSPSGFQNSSASGRLSGSPRLLLPAFPGLSIATRLPSRQPLLEWAELWARASLCALCCLYCPLSCSGQGMRIQRGGPEGALSLSEQSFCEARAAAPL